MGHRRHFQSCLNWKVTGQKYDAGKKAAAVEHAKMRMQEPFSEEMAALEHRMDTGVRPRGQ